jgi:hypothetical protein
MDTIAPYAPSPPAELRHRRARLAVGPDTAAHASGHVRSAIAAWSVPVNPAVAILLTSDLVINAVTNGADDVLTLGIRWSAGQLRVEIHDASVTGDSWNAGQNELDEKRGLLLVAALATDWGQYRTPAGRAVYYVLAFEPAETTESHRGDNPSHPPVLRPAAKPHAGPGAHEDPAIAPQGSQGGDGEP